MLNKLENYLIFAFSFLIPLFFLPLTPEAYEYPKMFLLMATSVLLLVITLTRFVLSRHITIRVNAFTTPLFLLGLLTLTSAILQSSNAISSLTVPMATGTLIAGILLFLLATEEFKDEYKGVISVLVTLSGIIVTVYTILLYVGFLPRGIATPAGNLLGTALLTATIAVFAGTKLVTLLLSHNAINLDFLEDDVDSKATRKPPAESKGLPIPKKPLLFWLAATLILTAGTGLLTIHLFTDQQPIILPFSMGWSILMDVLKNVKTLLLGIGPGNYITAFTLGKPITYNATPLFNITFTSSSSFLLTIATELGLIAVIFYGVIFFRLLAVLTKSSVKKFTDPSFIVAALFSLMAQIILPSYVSLFCMTMIFLALTGPRRTILDIEMKRLGLVRHILLLVPIIILSLGIYFGGRAYWGEILFRKSLDAFTAGRGTDAYTSGILAVAANPYQDRYRMTLAQINLALANALAGQKDLKEEDKQKIPKLTQAAIEEARNAVLLNRTSVTTWDNLARIYGSLLGYAQGADTWTVDTYKQRIALDPYNPNTRIALGGVYLTLQRFPDAEMAFREAVTLKPDFPNGYFNLGVALREQKKFPEAYESLQKSLSLLPAESEDAKKVTEELAKIPPDTTQSATLKPTEEPQKSATKGATTTPEPQTTRTPKTQ